MRACRERGHRYVSVQLVSLLVIIVFVRVDAFAPTPRQSRRSSSLFCTEQLLRDYGFGRRLQTLTPGDLPVTAELHDHGTWELCRIIQLEPPSKVGSPPRIQVQVKDDLRTVDLGQITTIWESNALEESNVQDQLDSFPMQHYELAMQNLYHNYSHRAQTSKGGLTKKNMSKIVRKKIKDEAGQAHTEDILRKMLKAGEGMARLVDSTLAMDYLYVDDYPETDNETALRRAVGGYAVAKDATLGGRFKRMACTFVSAEQTEDATMASITFVNGGWLVVDQSVRDGAEGRKFAQRTQEGSRILTAADERISHRLECLAMGEIFGAITDENELEVDVRESLKALDLPATPEGAQEALVRIGRWSEGQSAGRLEPWSQDTLSAAKEYTKADLERRKQLAKLCQRDAEPNIESRVDLTSLPAVCIDAKTTTFRDDAIGVRPRSSTGRKLVPEASKWEILIHIADVSDIYSPESSFLDSTTMEHLRAAAISRGTSRYDLPLGPLHLLPPVVLKSLGFVTNNPDSTKSAMIPNRCVTLWAYIDERNGKVLDAGLERTLISSPSALTYDSASKCLDNREKLEKNDPLAKATAVLALAERNLLLWSKQYKQTSEAARKREERLSAREIVSQNRKGFQRTRGHRLVDTALDLYGVALSQLLRRKKAPIPRASGSGADRMGRVATAPLRRLVDGMAQRQALSVLCGYGGRPLTVDECREVNAQANEAMDRLANIRPLKQKGVSLSQQRALAQLQTRRNRVVTAISTGRGNEVSIEGAVGKCQGVKGRLKPGQVVSVRVQTLYVETGILTVELVD